MSSQPSIDARQLLDVALTEAVEQLLADQVTELLVVGINECELTYPVIGSNGLLGHGYFSFALAIV